MTYLTHEDVQDRDTTREILRRLNQRAPRRFNNGGLILPDPTPAFLAALEYALDEGTPIPAPRRHTP